MNLTADLHGVPVLYAAADSLADTVTTDIVKGDSEGLLFVITKAVGVTGTSTITINACDTVVPGNTTDVPFMYKISTTPDIWGNWTQATATGFVLTAGSNQMYFVYVPSSNLGVTGYAYARMTLDEVEDSPVIAGVNVYQIKPGYAPVGVTKLT